MQGLNRKRKQSKESGRINMKIAFIGTGNMGGALARAAAREGENRLWLVNRHPEKAEALQKEIGGTVSDCAEAVRAAEMIFLGVKPKMLPALCEGLRPLLKEKSGDFTVVSMAAGVGIERLRDMLGDCPIIRIMPNTPVSVGEGMILYTAQPGADVDGFLHAMRFAGRFLPIEEGLMETGMAISGCGPAFVDLFVEALRGRGRPVPQGRARARRADGAGLGPPHSGQRQTPGRAQGRRLFARRHHDPGRAQAGGEGLPLRGDRGRSRGQRRIRRGRSFL